MSDKVIVTKKICITPDLINSNYNETIFQKLNSDFLNTCIQDMGYITKIYPNIKILENIISPTTSNVFFTVQFTAKVFFPKIDDEYQGIILSIMNTGILVGINEKLKVFIPEKNMKQYVYENNTFKHKKSKKELERGDMVDIILTAVKYEQQNFKCVGKLS